MATVLDSRLSRTPPSPHALLKRSPLLRSSTLLFRLTLLLVGVGVVCRCLRYFLHFPLWGDEALLCVNFLDRDYAGLTKKLDGVQVAPILFLWGELTSFRLFGGAEWSMRLLPFLASLGGLLLFWRLARLTASPLAALFAVGFLAVARWPVTMGAVVKPYSFDLFFALALLVPAVSWLRWPERRGWLLLLAAVVPFALMGSYPAVFVAGSISLALLPTVWQRRSFSVCSLYIVYNLLMFGTFLGCLLIVGREQLDPETGSVREAMQAYWADGFPPGQPLQLLKWLALINTGRLMAYPFGESNGGSIVTFLLFLVGVWRFWKNGRRVELVLFLTPFALNMLAAILHRYPYGACCRLSQHLAPAICLLAGVGVAALLERVARGFEWRLRGTLIVTGLFVVAGVGQSAVDLARPYRDEEALWSRKVMQEIDHLAAKNDQIVMAKSPAETWPMLRWQLHRLGKRVSWDGTVDWEQLEANGGRVWLVAPWLTDYPPQDNLPGGAARPSPWVRGNSALFAMRGSDRGKDNLLCTVSCWVPQKRLHTEPQPVISCWP